MSYLCFSQWADSENKAEPFVSDSCLSKGLGDFLAWNSLAPWHYDKEEGEEQTGEQY